MIKFSKSRFSKTNFWNFVFLFSIPIAIELEHRFFQHLATMAIVFVGVPSLLFFLNRVKKQDDGTYIDKRGNIFKRNKIVETIGGYILFGSIAFVGGFQAEITRYFGFIPSETSLAIPAFFVLLPVTLFLIILNLPFSLFVDFSEFSAHGITHNTKHFRRNNSSPSYFDRERRYGSDISRDYATRNTYFHHHRR